MKRRRPTRAELIARLPRAFRPKLLPDQIRDLSLAHYANLDAVHRGEASGEILWQMVGGILTWMRITEQLQRGVDEMLEQHELVLQIVARFVRTGAVTFAPGEYEVARRGVEVMDALAELVDRPTAIAAAEWSELRVLHMEHQAKEAA
ncbi:hypothetical protein [Aquincola sp. J276]|uniref:hypothetical protein n=1 Tax=Aquincola sp. J276 TaxID=2898432 RepID=UPI00215118A5|nr:hypothetical protein [Aquincola sp. J276]MCR5864681.1 hypothetical protein [Aquincola sp. J276]